MCPTLLSLLSLGFCVSLRIWAAVGEYEKPSLSAWPSPVVPLGQTVTLQCHSNPPFVIFRLFKRHGARLRKLQEQQFNTFTLGPVTREHAGSYTCSGANLSRSVRSNVSDPLPIVVTGVSTKPSISAHPGPLVREGENVTLRCHSSMLLDKFILQKKTSTGHFQRRGETLTGGHAPADFSIGPMTLASAGTYRCYGSFSHSPYVWSTSSDPVDIIITGRSRKPSLSAQGGPVVRSGENVTLVCSSESTFDQFHLLREGEDLGHPLAGGRGPHGELQAEFPLGPGTPAHSGVYRCYGSFTPSPYSWSDSSNPLFLSVTGSTTSTCPSTMDPHTTEETQLPQEHSGTWYIVLGLVIAFTSTSILLAALVCHSCSTPNHVAIMAGEPMEDRTVNGEVNSAAEDVIYAHLDLGTLSERRFTPTPLRPVHPSAEPIIYEEFNINQDHTEP
ncbi:putative killer cell immunoglobulin-like receptor-like protein KIR3DX1 [Oryx dammah]|uniref:putative killer cell immunoglobulin-like receptor-like protein KIR3DX1 n=1 Tax=Oryx dammah TaxID=59534 RepID=UPI001A9AE7D9|nr:putative killer cell immunoglobulin-like receptor-like protein KIR3DX1 [Oryx dammah]